MFTSRGGSECMTVYVFVDQFNLIDSFTAQGLTGGLALQNWDMTMSVVVVVVTVLLILSDYCRLSSASNPVWLWDLILYIDKKGIMYFKWEMYENSILFSGQWQIFFHVLSAIVENASIECYRWNLTFSDCNCKCICCLNDSSYLSPCLRMYL